MKSAIAKVHSTTFQLIYIVNCSYIFCSVPFYFVEFWDKNRCVVMFCFSNFYFTSLHLSNHYISFLEKGIGVQPL